VVSLIDITRLACDGFKVISKKGRKILVVYSLSLSFLSILDGFALLLLSKSFLIDSSKSDANLTFQPRPLVFVVILFLFRSIVSVGVSYISVHELAKEETRLGQLAFNRFLSNPWIEIRNWKQSQLFMEIDRAPNGLVQGFLFLVATIFAELFSAVIIFSTLLFLQPVTAFATLIFFVIVAVLQHKWLSLASSRAGRKIVQSQNLTYDLLSDAHMIGKVLRVMPSSTLEESVNLSRLNLARARASSNFYSMLPRYFMESILALGFVVVAAATFLVLGPDAIFLALTVFAAAGFRLLPIVNRIQGLVLTLYSGYPLAVEAISSAKKVCYDLGPTNMVEHSSRYSSNIVSLNDVSFRFPDSDNDTLQEISVTFEHGKQYAIVGRSGSGKSTMLDLILGILKPTSGEVVLGDGRIGYVPQDSSLITASLEGNVALEWEDGEIEINSVNSALLLAKLDEIRDRLLKNNNEPKDGIASLQLSGGQKQRVGIARALYRSPTILVLDEATSALDTETEHEIMQTIEGFRGVITTIIVAHRLTTVQNADEIIFLDNGKIQGVGSFSELKMNSPTFAKMVKLGTLSN